MYDLVIIGAGVVGLSIAQYFQVERHWQCLVVEKEEQFGQGISSRNSEVIHAGFYYATGSLKAGLCIEGKNRLYSYLKRNNLPFRRCGKYVLAPPDRTSELERLQTQGRINGVDDLEWVGGRQVQGLYRELAPHPALHSPSTGILSVDALMHHLAGEFRAAGGDLAVKTAFTAMTPQGEEYVLTLTSTSGEAVSLPAQRVINAAGLGALEVAGRAGFDYKERGYRLGHCKGSYFRVPGARRKFHHLIYPLPTPTSLGIHLRLDLQDEVRLGPDVEYLPDGIVDYTVDPALEREFRERVREYWPKIDGYDLEPDWAGIRPHLFVGSKRYHDFHIVDERDAGCPGWVNMMGIDSPGLTSALAFGPYINGLWT